MTTMQIIGLAIKVSLIVLVFCVALNTQKGDMVSLFRKPGLLLRSLLSMNVAAPLIAVGIAVAFELDPQIELALIALSVSPVPPILPAKTIKAGASTSYSVALLALSAVVAIVAVPGTISLLSRAFGRPVDIPVATIFKMMVMSLVLPLLAGALVRQFVPGLAAKIVRPLTLIANILLFAAIVPVLVIAWPQLVAHVGNFTLVGIIVMVLLCLVAGHVFGGPDPGDRTALALCSATRHPGVAIAVASAVVPNDKSVVMAVLLAFLVSVVATIPYTKWRQKHHKAVQS